MKIVIDIPRSAYTIYKEWNKQGVATLEESIIANGTPLPNFYIISQKKFLKRRKKMNYCRYIGDNCKFNNDCENCEHNGNLEPASDRAKFDSILAIEHILCNFSRYE